MLPNKFSNKFHLKAVFATGQPPTYQLCKQAQFCGFNFYPTGISLPLMPSDPNDQPIRTVEEYLAATRR